MAQLVAVKFRAAWGWTAFCILLTVIPQLSSANNRFYGALAPKTATAAVNEDCPRGMNPARFEKLLLGYPALYHDSSKELEQWDLEDQITTAIFCVVGTSRYVEYLKQVDTDSSKDQEAYYNLAKRLQTHWETQYALGLSKIQHQRMQRVTDDTRNLSLLISAFGMFKPTKQVPTYFYLVRQLFPVLLPGIAAGGTHLLNRTGMLDGKYPLSPAHVMTLPLPAENTNYDTYDIVRDVSSAITSVAGAQLAYNAAKDIRLVLSLGKVSFNPVTIVASYAAGMVAQQVTDDVIDEVQYHRLESRMLRFRDEILQAIAAKDYMKMRTSAEDFKNAAIMLSAFLDRESLTIWVQYDKDLQSANADPKWKEYAGAALLATTGVAPAYFYPTPADRARKAADAAEKRDEQLEVIQANQDPESLQDVELAIALNVMSQDPGNVSVLDGEQKSQGALIAKGFQLGGGGDYPSYIHGLEQEKNSMLAQELREGRIHRNPSHILLQAAAFIRSLGQPPLDSTSDDLLNIIYSGEMLK